MTGDQLNVELARGYATRSRLPLIVICRGSTKGCDGSLIGRCRDCYLVAADDPHSSAEILADMERGDA